MQAILQCSILGSSIALLSGQKPAFRLLARAISLANGQPVPHIKPAVSEAFVVATPRVKSAQKVGAAPPSHSPYAADLYGSLDMWWTSPWSCQCRLSSLVARGSCHPTCIHWQDGSRF